MSEAKTTPLDLQLVMILL